MARLTKPRQTDSGWTVAVRDPRGRRATLGPYPTEDAAMVARVEWHMERCWEANLRTVAALDQAEAALAESWVYQEA